MSAGPELGGARYPPGPPEHWPPHRPAQDQVGAPAGPAATGSTDEPGPGRRPPIVVVAVALVLVLVAGAVAWAATRDGGDALASDDAPTSSAPAPGGPVLPTEPAPTMPPLPGLDPGAFGDPAEAARPLREVLPEIIELVETTREHRFVTEPTVEALGPEEFERRLLEAMEDDATADRPGDRDATYRALGLIDADDDLDALAQDAALAGVLGFYLPGEGDLLVKGDVVTPLVQSIIAHELTHALDDQIFDLTRLDDLTGRPDEAAFGLLAVVEGSAERVREAFVAQLGADERIALESERLSLGLDQVMALADIPPALLVESQVPYGAGLRLVEDLVARGGVAALDTAMVDPPTTSEQVLDPDVYRAREPAVAVPRPEADGDVVDEGVVGAVDLRVLEAGGDPMGLLGEAATGALEPIEGFGGGSYVTWVDGGGVCLRMVVVGDDPAGSVVVRELLEAWAAANAPDAELVDAAGPDGRFGTRATACA